MKTDVGLNQRVVPAIERHYKHAKEKHPYFCDRLIPGKDYAGNVGKEIENNLREIRSRIDRSIKSRRCEWNELLNEEVWEVLEAIYNGENDNAVEECYDAISVLLRVIDVLEGRQSLGKPKKEGTK